jgi:hypothetical protein
MALSDIPRRQEGRQGMPTLNLDPDFFDHPKARRLAGILGPCGEVWAIRLWAYCTKYHWRDGIMAGYSAEELESVIGWHGEQGKCTAALVRVGVLVALLEDRLTDAPSNASSNASSNARGYAVHEWVEHQGHIAIYHDKAKTASESRWVKLRGENAPPSIAPSIAPSNPSAGQRIAVHLNTSASPSTAPAAASPEPEKAKAPPPRRGNGTSHPDHAAFIAEFTGLWKAAKGTTYPFQPKDGAAAKAILASMNGESWHGLLKRYFSTSDDFVREKNGLSLSFLRSSLPRWKADPKAVPFREDI